MCTFTEIEFGCGHLRYTAREWCLAYVLSQWRCPPEVVAVESKPKVRCGDCCEPSIHPSWVVRIGKVRFDEKLVVAPTRLLMHQTLAVTEEKLQNQAICICPPHSSLPTTAALVGLHSPITSIYLPCEPRSTPQSIQTCLVHPWLTCTMSDSVCTAVTSGDSNLGDTTITHETTGRVAGLVCKKRKQMSLEGEEETRIQKKRREGSNLLVQQTTPEGLIDIHRREQSCFDKDCHVIGTDSVTQSVSDLTQALKIQKNHPVLIEATQQFEQVLSGSRDSLTIFISDFGQALKIQKNYQVLVEATQQLEMMLSGSRDAGIIASKILSRLSSAEMVLLSCSTVIDREDFSPLRQSSGYWFEDKEEEAFCRKFSFFMPGSWGARDILGKWENLCKVLTKCFHMWGTKVCVKVWADCDTGNCDYSKMLQKVRHQNTHRIYEEEKVAIGNRSGSAIQWDLVGMRVTADVLPR